MGYSTIVNDFDGDTYPDIAVYTYGDEIEFLKNNGSGGFNSPQIIESGLHYGYYDMTLGDLDGDGIKDILYPSSDYFPGSPNIMKWYKSDGAGNFSIHNLMVVDTNYVVTNIVPADIDNNGHKDIVASMYDRVTYKGMIKVFWNQGSEVFDTSKYEVITTAIDYTDFVRVDDIDGDGDQDILTATFGGSGGMAWFQNQLIPNKVNESEFNPSNLAVYPNPATDQLTIISSEKVPIEISNIEGQIIKTISSDGKANVDVSMLARGMYFIKAKTERGVVVKKFVKE
jgi:hypothetical protein